MPEAEIYVKSTRYMYCIFVSLRCEHKITFSEVYDK